MKNLLSALIIFLLTASLCVAQGDEIIPGDNLVVEGIPKIPAALAETISRYTEFRSASLMSWHPTRREMLITQKSLTTLTTRRHSSK